MDLLITHKDNITINEESLNQNDLKYKVQTKSERNIKQLNYKFKNVLLIFEQIFQFLNKDDINNLCICDKHIYQLYCNQIKKLKIYGKDYILNIPKLIIK